MKLLPAYGRLTDPTEAISAWLGGTPDEIPDIYHMASPLSHIGSHCPPTLLINGEYDVVMGPGQHYHLAAALRQADIPVVHVAFPYTNHGFDIILPQWSPTAQAALYDVERFLAFLSAS
jgi:acetyl esterase/lipase